jgi:hypothetical protein
MEENKVRAWYDKSVDIFYMLFKEGPSYEVIEADPNVHPSGTDSRELRTDVTYSPCGAFSIFLIQLCAISPNKGWLSSQ